MTLISFVIEETRVRSHFNAEYGLHLPEDLCLCIGNSPTRWEVVPSEGSSLEVLPSIDADLIPDVGVFKYNSLQDKEELETPKKPQKKS